MQELKLSKAPKCKIIIDDVEHLCRKPTFGQMAELEKSMKEDSSKVEALINFFEGCGLKREVFSGLNYDDLEAIKDFLMPKKKS